MFKRKKEKEDSKGHTIDTEEFKLFKANVEEEFKLFKANVEEDLKMLKKEVKQLKCPHKSTELVDEWELICDRTFKRYSIVCKDCGKELKRLKTEEWMREKIKRSRENTDKLKDDLEDYLIKKAMRIGGYK